MGSLTMAVPDTSNFQPALVVLLRDGFTGDSELAGDVTVQIGSAVPLVPDPAQATFLFMKLANGTYSVNVQSTSDEPYYFPASILVTLPFPRPAKSLWAQPPIWTGYPDLVLADPNKLLDDPQQTPEYLAQLQQTTLSPTTAYPFPAGTTLVRGTITGAGVPLTGAFVTTQLEAQAGQFPVIVANPSGPPAPAINLTVVSTPVVDSLEPPTVIAGSANFTLYISGSGFEPGAVAKLNGIALPTTVMSAAFLTAQVTAAQVAAVGQQTVLVANPDGTVSNTPSLAVVAAPVIASITPASVTAGSVAFTLTVQGSGFSATSVIELNGAAITTTFLSSTVLTGSVAASSVANAGVLSTIVTPGGAGTNSNVQALTVVTTPVITALEPATAIAGNPAFTLTVQGSGFVSGATVGINGVSAPTSYVSATQVLAQITAAQITNAALLSVVVTNPNKTASNPRNLTVAAAPAIASIDPATVTADSSAFTITVRGSGFMTGAAVLLNGVSLQTTYLNSEQLYAIVPRSGYTTGADGTFVLFVDDVQGLSQVERLIVTHPSYPKAKLLDVTVLRGATVSVNVDMSS